MPKLQKLKPDKNRDNCTYRIAAVNAESTNEAERSIDLVLATETPVPVFDFSRMDVVDEIIDMSGVDLPRQIPLVDSHDRFSVRNVLGSIRDLRVEGSQLLGRAYFSTNPEAVAVFRNYQEGHLTDFSIGAKRIDVEYDGDTRRVTRSRPVEGSAVAVGADPNAKALSVTQRAYLEPAEMKGEAMSELIDSLRAEFGIPDDVKNDKVATWLKENQTTRAAVPAEKPKHEEPATVPVKPETPETPATLDRAAIEAEIIERHSSVRLICRNAGLDQEQTDAHVASGKTANEIAGDILRAREQDKTSPKPSGIVVEESQRIEHGASQADKFYAAASDGLTLRCLDNVGVNPDAVIERHATGNDRGAVERAEQIKQRRTKPAVGYDRFQFASLSDIARECLHESGVRGLDRMPRQEIVRQAFMQRGATNTTGSFTNLLLDASNKTLLAGYDEQMTTYQMWARQAASAADFKNLNRIRFGELPDPEEVPENFPYPDKSPTDNKESYVVKKHGEIFSITLEAVINDDLDAISRIPAMHGAAHRRKVNKAVYSVLTTNGNLSDAVALFHATSHGANLDATALSAAALNVGYAVMMAQTGLSSDTILNIMPRFLIVGAGLSSTALQIVNSTANPDNAAASTEDASRPNFNAGTANLYGPGGPRGVVVVVDATLGGQADTKWYLAADPRQVDTVEVTFLQGEETPVLTREESFDVDAIRFKSRQSFAAAAIDYRGLYQGNA